MKIDFHTHGKLAKKLPFSKDYTNWLFEEAALSGLDALCLTEHFNTIGFHEIYQYIETNYRKDGDSYIAGNLRIFPGMEVDIAEDGHILVIGTLDDILTLNQKLEPNKEKDHFLPFSKLVELTSNYPVLLGAAHPYRSGGHIPELQGELLNAFDFIDLNGKDVAENLQKTQTEVYSFAKELNLPVLAGSDTHQSFQYGCIYNDFINECSTTQELLLEAKNQAYRIEISETANFQVKTASILKRSLKEIHSLGGDYVSILTQANA